jgi:CheY-like chemotaxis protein/HPt (histidine-containing phosphotransfer) domain-containing protein
MHGVLGMLELMIKSGKLDATNYEFARSASRSGNDLLRLFDDLLQIAKLESGVVKIDPKEIDLRKMMDDTLIPFRSECATRDIDLIFNLSETMPEKIIIDDLRLRQIINNLVSNAIKYTDEGSVDITIDLEMDDAKTPEGQRKRMRLEVKDTGIGIAGKDMGLLFTPFVKISSHRSRSVAGSGLGLSITHGLVKLLNGQISIDSKIGKGTAVKVLLPLAEESDGPDMGEDPYAANQFLKELKDLRILVAEDNEINRMLVSAHLSSMGCLVTNVRNGMEAVRACAERTFDVVIMDLSMPVMHGFEAAKQILSNARADLVAPVIIGCTADASEHAASRCLEVGMRSVIVKPFTRDELALTIKSHAIANSQRLAENTSSFDEQATKPAVNETVLKSLEANISGDPNILNGILAIFREDSLLKIRDIVAAIEAGDTARCSATAHSLKGGAASVGADRLSHYCAIIEDACLSCSGHPISGAILPRSIEDKLLSSRADYFEVIDQRRDHA